MCYLLCLDASALDHYWTRKHSEFEQVMVGKSELLTSTRLLVLADFQDMSF
jgi:hypothetical protein